MIHVIKNNFPATSTGLSLKSKHAVFSVRYNLNIYTLGVLVNNVIKYNLTQLFIKGVMNIQLSATCFGLLEPSSG